MSYNATENGREGQAHMGKYSFPWEPSYGGMPHATLHSYTGRREGRHVTWYTGIWLYINACLSSLLSGWSLSPVPVLPSMLPVPVLSFLPPP